MAGTEFKVGDIVRFKSKENLKGVHLWFEAMRADLPKEFKVTSVTNDGRCKISGHNTNYTIIDKMLELVGSTLDNKAVEFKAGDRVRFKSLEECKKLPNWNSSGEMDYLSGKEFTIAETRESYHFGTKEIIPEKVFEGRSWCITDTMIEHIPVKKEEPLFKAGDRVRFKSTYELSNMKCCSPSIPKFAGKEFTIGSVHKAYTTYSDIQFEIIPTEESYSGYFIYDTMIEHIPKESYMDKFSATVEPREGYKGYPEYSSFAIPVPKFYVPDFMRTATGATYAAKNGMPNPYGTSVCDAIQDASRYLSKADYEISQEYFNKKHSKKEYKKRITFSKVQ